MRHIFLIVTLIISHAGLAQKYYTKTGLTEFKASVDTFEPVEARNENSTGILNMENGEVAALIFVKSFHFKVALMEEHFNENYMDSDKYPKATFKGKIENFSNESLFETPKKFMLNGKLTIRGIEREISTEIVMSSLRGKIHLGATFLVRPGDFDISIPSIVRSKVAEEVKIKLDYELVQKK